MRVSTVLELPPYKLNAAKLRMALAGAILGFLNRPNVKPILAGRCEQTDCFLFWLGRQQTVLDNSIKVILPAPDGTKTLPPSKTVMDGLYDQTVIHLGMLLCFFVPKAAACNRPPEEDEDEAAADMIAAPEIDFSVPAVATMAMFELESARTSLSQSFPPGLVWLYLLLFRAVRENNAPLVAEIMRSPFMQTIRFIDPALFKAAEKILATPQPQPAQPIPTNPNQSSPGTQSMGGIS
jgi:hypothetical protein